MNLNRSVIAVQRRAWMVGALMALALACMVTVPASAQTWVGTSGIDNSWFTGTNWAGGVSPDSSSAAASILVPPPACWISTLLIFISSTR